MNLGGKQFVLESGAHRAVIAEVGAGLQGYTVDGVDVTVPYGEDVLPPKCCGTTLVPWPNRIRDGRYSFDGTDYQLALTEPGAHNAIHGLGRWARWAKTAHTADRVALRLDVVPQNGYPFPVRVTVEYELDAEAGLRVTLSARNAGRVRAPFGAGSHPYLSTRGHDFDDVTLRLPARERVLVDEQQIPVGTSAVRGTEYDLRRGRRLRGLRMDTGFTGLTGDSAELRTRSGGARLWFDDAFRYLQVFTPDGLAGVAIEPMTCAPDAFNSGAGLIVLDPGGSWRGSWGITPLG